VQDLDRSQLRLALLLAAPHNRIFLVGDDDQTIYAWRLADVRRVLGLAADLPGLRRVDLVTNYRCPPAVVARAVRLVEHNGERFPKTIRAGPKASGRLFLAPDPGDDVARARRLLASWQVPDPEGRAVLARTNAELAPYAAIAVETGIPYAVDDDGLLLDDPALDALLGSVHAGQPLLVVLGRLRRASPPELEAVAAALLAWAAPYREVGAFRKAITAARERRRALRSSDARLVLATAHGTKGLEFDHVACVGLDEGRFPSARSLAESDDPERVMEEERRLAYVAWTRARRSLVLIHDPAAPSPFMKEAFDPGELAVA
jgi:superfamily I DNA/RNA helicase